MKLRPHHAAILFSACLVLVSRTAEAVVPPSVDWIEVQRYTSSEPNRLYHFTYLIPSGNAIYLVRISNFAKATASPIVVLQSLDLGTSIPPGRSWQVIHRWEKNPPSGEGDVQFEATYAIPIGSAVHLIRTSNLAGIELERLPGSPLSLR